MFEKLRFNMDKVYPTLVVSTMSSGKSTLINAIVGKELLPSRNRACTAKAVAILDNDMKQAFEIHAVTKDGKYNLLKEASKTVVANFNETNDVYEMILEGQIKGIKNRNKSLLLVDTPGINNSMDQTHEFVTKKVLDDYAKGLILYVINAQQIGTYDDSEFLGLIANKLKDNDRFNIIFVINKMDLVDPQNESPRELIENCKDYIEGKGINKPVIIPVSASSALILKKILQGDVLSELEEENFTRCYRRFKNESFSLVNFASTPEKGDMNETGEIEGIKFTRAQIYAALHNTGLTYLEKVIDETLGNSSKIYAPKISFAGISRKEAKPITRKNTKKRSKSKNNKMAKEK